MSFFFFLLLFIQICNANTFLFPGRFLSLYRNMKKNVPSKYDPCQKERLIISTPAGLHGFYLFGVSTFIKENYNISDYVFSGASAGSWNSLFLSFKGNDTEFIEGILSPHIYNVTNVLQIEKNMKQHILENYEECDFDICKLNFGITIFKLPLRLKLKIYDSFDSLEDVLNACIASSHIPFITGGLIHIYKRRICFDGGFFSYPYLKYIGPDLIINPNIWNSSLTSKSNFSLQEFFKSDITTNNVTQLFNAGYEDSKKNKEILDAIFL